MARAVSAARSLEATFKFEPAAPIQPGALYSRDPRIVEPTASHPELTGRITQATMLGHRFDAACVRAHYHPGQGRLTTVRSSRFPTGFRIMAVLSLCLVSISTARADAISSSWTVVDLGSSGGFVTPPGPNGSVGGVNGPVYAFPQSFTGSIVSTPANFTLADPVPTSYDGIPGQGFSFVQGGVMLYPNGIAMAMDEYGFNAYTVGTEYESWRAADIYYVQRNPDGTWGQPVVLMSTGRQTGNEGLIPNITASLSKSGYVVELTSSIPGLTTNDTAVYNIYTHQFTDLSRLPQIVNNGYSNLIGTHIDDNGDILAYANHVTGPNSEAGNDLVLLIPPGASPSPIEAAAPEPGSWAVMALAMTAFTMHRLRTRRLCR